MKILHYGIVLLFMVTVWGCSQGNSSAPVTIDPTTNKHPLGWAVNGTGGTHPLAYFNAPTSCQSCHGLPSDPKGGISGVSCSNPGRSGVACHPSFPHSPGFAQFSRHGSVAKDTASGVTGMAHCKQCHGGDYNGSGLAPSCIKCHNDYNASNHAPHAANWVSLAMSTDSSIAQQLKTTLRPATSAMPAGPTRTRHPFRLRPGRHRAVSTAPCAITMPAIPLPLLVI